MRIFYSFVLLLCVSVVAKADLKEWVDYERSAAVWVVTTVKVDSNMGEAYLEGLANTYVPSQELQKKLGHIEDYKIYFSDMPASGDFNLLLVVKFANTADLAPNKAKYDAFMKEFTEEKSDKATEKAQKDYPGMREITGDYMFREITIK